MDQSARFLNGRLLARELLPTPNMAGESLFEFRVDNKKLRVCRACVTGEVRLPGVCHL